MLASTDSLFSFGLRSSWVLVWQVIFLTETWTLSCYKTFCFLQLSLAPCWQEGTMSLLPVGPKVQVPHWPQWTPRRGLQLIAGQVWEFQLLAGPLLTASRWWWGWRGVRVLLTAPCLPPLTPWWGQGGEPSCCWGMVGAPAVQEAASDTVPPGRGICYWWVGWCPGFPRALADLMERVLAVG